ncbi:DUF3177 family protein [Synechococcus elongatus]|uniref:DUF3177 family protein n=1 Tax=Synechococcus elongatus TaxID=32046 RepID=UPI0030CDAD66
MISQNLLRSLVWTDYRLAVLILVFIPLVLLVWSLFSKLEAIQRLMLIYWRVASLLAITVLMMVAALPLSFLTGFLARLLIPISLWFWVDLNEEVEDLPRFRPLRLGFTAWRWAVTIYSGLGLLLSARSLPCSFLPREVIVQDAICNFWLSPPYGLREWLLSGYKPGLISFFGVFGLVVYGLCLVQFLLTRLPRQGRCAL